VVVFGFASAEFAFATNILGDCRLPKSCVGDFSSLNMLYDPHTQKHGTNCCETWKQNNSL